MNTLELPKKTLTLPSGRYEFPDTYGTINYLKPFNAGMLKDFISYYARYSACPPNFFDLHDKSAEWYAEQIKNCFPEIASYGYDFSHECGIYEALLNQSSAVYHGLLKCRDEFYVKRLREQRTDASVGIGNQLRCVSRSGAKRRPERALFGQPREIPTLTRRRRMAKRPPVNRLTTEQRPTVSTAATTGATTRGDAGKGPKSTTVDHSKESNLFQTNSAHDQDSQSNSTNTEKGTGVVQSVS